MTATFPSASSTRLTRSPAASLHRQLFMVLRDEIGRGLYAATGALPTEEALGERFGVSRITVRRALGDLAALDVIERRHGLGTFVKPGRLGRPLRPTLSLIDSLDQTAAHTDGVVLGVARAVPPTDVAALLQLRNGTLAMHARRLRFVSDEPVMLTEAWVPAAFGRSVTVAALKKRALYEVLLARGVRFGRVVQEITAQVADPASAAQLRIDVGSPMLKLVRLMHDLDAEPVLHLTACMSPDRSRILMDIPGGQVNTLPAGRVVHDALIR